MLGNMLFFYVSVFYTIINLVIAAIMIIKSKRSFLSRFYFVCIIFLVIFGVISFLSEFGYGHKFLALIEPIIVFLFSLIPFFFLHFIIIFTGQYKVLEKKIVIYLIYFAGLFSYTAILLGLIPNPLSSSGVLTQSGYLFYITWMSVFFAIGVSQIYHFFSSLSDKGRKSNLLFSSFALLILILPGPFAESILNLLFGNSQIWYTFTSILALMIVVYFVFRHKSVVTSYDALKASLSVMDNIFITTNEDFIIEMARGATKKILNYEEKELLGKPLSLIIIQEDNLKSYKTFTMEGKMKEGFFNVEAKDKNGKPVPMNFSLSPMYSNDIIIGFIGLGRDISEQIKIESELREIKENLERQVLERTLQLAELNIQLQKDIEEKKKVEEDLRLLNEQLAQSNASKDKFFSIVAHDLKAPFQGLLGYSNILLEEYSSLTKAELKEYAVSINDITKNIFNLVENLLSWARSQLGRMDFQPITINIKETILKIINVLSHNAIKKNIQLDYDVDDKILVNADEKMLHSIISNLINNAIKFTRDGGFVKVTARLINDFVEVTVQDNGIGISPEDQSKLFRIDTSFRREGTAAEEGTGLGLILCKELIERHNGKIWLESEEGKGATFYFTLPVVL